MLKLKGSEILINKLRENGIDTIFGYPGGVLLPFYDALCESEIEHILVRHEQAAAHAADGYARASGKVGVCLATSGPGATNVTTGIATAHMDSSPIIALTGQVPTGLIGKDVFQEVDTLGITMPISKHNYQPRTADKISEVVDKSFYIASTGRPGPVIIDLPRNALEEEFDIEELNPDTTTPGYKPKGMGNIKQIKKAVEVILSSEKPIILAGGGAILANASEELLEFARLTNIPVATSLMGKGIIDEEDPLSFGMIGMHGIRVTNKALTECDCLISIGCRFSDRSVSNTEEFAKNAIKIHIDVDPAEIGKTIPIDIPIVGDAKLTLEEFIKEIKERQRPTTWTNKLIQLKQDDQPFMDYTDVPLKPQRTIKELMEALDPDTIITTDVGQNQMWMAHYYKTRKPRTFISSGGLGTMGFGLPAAMGAQVAKPDESVVAIVGDGGFAMVSQELATIKENDLPVVTCILNNRYLGMVAQLQRLFNEHVYATKLTATPDFVKLAEAYGIEGARVEKPGELKETIQNAIKSREATVIDVVIDDKELLPIVPPGKGLENMKMTFEDLED